MSPIRAPPAFHIGGSESPIHPLPRSDDDDKIGIQNRVLSPEEVLQLARSLDSPVIASADKPEKGELRRRKSAGSATSRHSISGHEAEEEEKKKQMALEPVEYVQMDDDTLLPFMERPKEVSELVTHPSNEKMFALLKAAFPKHPLRKNWQSLDPTEWYWSEVVAQLTTVDRFAEPDYLWISKLRQAVRERSVSLWEKLGVCLGCDGDLLTAGGEDDGIPPSWGGLGLGEEGEYMGDGGQVWVEGLMAETPTEVDREKFDVPPPPPSRYSRGGEDMFAEFGEIVEDEEGEAGLRMRALDTSHEMVTIGEMEEEPIRHGHNLSPLRKSHRASSDVFSSPSSENSSSRLSPNRSRRGGRQSQGSITEHPGPIKLPSDPSKIRSKSFVGLQIMTSPTLPQHPTINSYSPESPFRQTLSPIQPNEYNHRQEREPGNPLFPGTFSSLSLAPNLGRMASVAAGLPGGMGVGVKDGALGLAHRHDGHERGARWGLSRKASGAGLSESKLFETSIKRFDDRDLANHPVD